MISCVVLQWETIYNGWLLTIHINSLFRFTKLQIFTLTFYFPITRKAQQGRCLGVLVEAWPLTCDAYCPFEGHLVQAIDQVIISYEHPGGCAVSLTGIIKILILFTRIILIT